MQTFTVFGAVYGDYYGFNHKATFGVDDRADFGAAIQVGVFISRAFELAVRYSIVAPDDHFKALTGNKSVFNEITVGGNYFFGPDGDWANHLKLSIDVDILPDGTPGDPALLLPRCRPIARRRCCAAGCSCGFNYGLANMAAVWVSDSRAAASCRAPASTANPHCSPARRQSAPDPVADHVPVQSALV